MGIGYASTESMAIVLGYIWNCIWLTIPILLLNVLCPDGPLHPLMPESAEDDSMVVAGPLSRIESRRRSELEPQRQLNLARSSEADGSTESVEYASEVRRSEHAVRYVEVGTVE